MILELAVSLLAVAGFGFAVWRIRIVPVARRALEATLDGLSLMMDSELSDDVKEVAARRAGISLIVASFNIFWRFAIALAFAAAPIIVADSMGFVSRETVYSLMLRWDYIIIVSIVAMLHVRFFGRRRSAETKSTLKNSQYSTTDRFFHTLAFSSPRVLRSASWIEDRLTFEATEIASDPPIFITSLARGGTTALLNALHDVPRVATHTYRDMPFLTSPMLWNRLAGGQKRSVERHQRAHRDGLEIDLDTPEAFEEVIWKMFWPENFKKTSIAMWASEHRKPDAEQFLKHHMAKVVRSRAIQNNTDPTRAVRYCSKNNANIARISYLLDAFPNCSIVVPLRRPDCHAASLLRQHQNFSKLQSEDDFTKRYMCDIGHFDFGEIHKPIHFPEFDSELYNPDAGNYWLNYWIHAFRNILNHSDSCIFVLQDDLRAAPQMTMTALCNALDLAPGTMAFTCYFLSSTDQSQSQLYDQRLLEEANEIYRVLEGLALSSLSA